MDCEHKLQKLKKKLVEKDKILIAFSGGVDSSLLAKVANDVLGENALCMILDSETMPRSELENAKALARSLGINCQVMKYSILDYPEIIKNTSHRCYLCKKESARMLKNMKKGYGIHLSKPEYQKRTSAR